VNSTDAPAEVIAVQEAPLQALRQWAQTLPEAKQKELAPIIIALADKLDAKPAETVPPEPAKPKPTVTSSNDPTSMPHGQQDNTTKKEGETDMEQIKSDEIATAIKDSLTQLAAQVSALVADVTTLKENVVRAKQDSLPRGVLQRVFSDQSSILSDAEKEKLVPKETDVPKPVADIAASIMNRLGGGN
jgi:hypothetical protein